MAAALVGVYRRNDATNDWHAGHVTAGDDARSLRWTNDAGCSWALHLATASPASDGSWCATTGSDCPYAGMTFTWRVAARHFAMSIEPAYTFSRVGDLPPSGTPLADALLARLGRTGELTPLGARALEAFLTTTAAYQCGDVAAARAELEALWAAHPPGTAAWDGAGTTKFGSNFGSPTCYYALRMMQEVVAFASTAAGGGDGSGGGSGGAHAGGAHGGSGARAAVPLNFTIVAVPHIRARVPTTLAEATSRHRESWHEVTRTIQPALVGGGDDRCDDDGFAGAALCHTTFDGGVPPVWRTTLYWFGEYLWAVSGGRLQLHVRMAPLAADFTAAGEVQEKHAGLHDYGAAVDATPAAVRDTTDVWLVTFPSITPQLGTREYITGGMGGATGVPCFIADDAFFVRHPPHLGAGAQSHWERAAYLPQWLQHEFNHALFNRYFPEAALEGAAGHEWFDRATWPADFVGTHEADYYHEAMAKRFLVPAAQPPLWQRLKRWSGDALRAAGVRLDVDVARDLVGTWQADDPANDWLHVTITAAADGTHLTWRNRAGVAWRLTPDLPACLLRTSDDCPYAPEVVTIAIDVARALAAATGSAAPRASLVTHLVFNGDTFKRV